MLVTLLIRKPKVTTTVLAQAVLALAVLARAVQRQSHPVNCSREVVIGALGGSFVFVRRPSCYVY